MRIKTDKGKKIVYCGCGYSTKELSRLELKERVKPVEKEIDVISDDEEALPVAEAECPKCGNNEAFYKLVQTRAGDEPETKFMKCKKCKHVWRDYG